MLLALAGALAFAAMAAGHHTLSRALAEAPRRRSPREQWPSITIVRPIKALDVGARENLDALFDLDYPAKVQVLFVLDDVLDPACGVTRDVTERRRSEGHDVELLLAGAPPPGRTGKLHAMAAGLARSTGELIAFSDSDTRVPTTLLRELVGELLDTPRAGDTFAPVVVQWETDRPTAGDVGFALLLNGWYGPSAALAAGVTSDLPFIMGQLMVLRRETLDAIGGLSCADGQLVDDMWLGRRVTESGLRNVQIRSALPIITGGLSLTGFLATFRRWLLFSRTGLPSTFTRPHWWRGALYGLSLVLLGVSIAQDDALGILASGAAAALFVASQVRLHRERGGPPVPLQHLWVPMLLPLLGGGVMVAALFSSEVNWRGRTYKLDAGARLSTPSPARNLRSRSA